MKSDTLKAIEEELARQNEALASFESLLASLGDVELQIPKAFFEEIDEVTAPRNPMPTMPFGIRG